MQSVWEIHNLSQSEQQVAKQLAETLNISQVSAAILVRRGLLTPEAAREFISPKLRNLSDPFLMKDMDKAVERLRLAIDRNEHILIYGDYDVDGTTAVALTYRFLQNHYSNIDFYIPDRYTEGYGISYKGVDYAEQNHCTLVIALDCGIRNNAQIDYAAEKGIDFIICDHHLPGTVLPAAVAVLDPKRADCTFPCKDLSGCGVGFCFVQAYAQKNGISTDELMPLLELTAMSIASDIVPIVGENRILAYHGLRMINLQPSVGVASLLQKAGLENSKVTISDLVYRIGPRLNACGRIESGREAVQLLITKDTSLANRISESIDEHNRSRKELDQTITAEALQLLQNDPDNSKRMTNVVCGKNWHKGVVGIVASRLTESYYRPTIVLTECDGIVSGSARSVAGFDIYTAIDSCRDLLDNFGGHIFAAGLSMKTENYPAFRERFDKYVREHILPEQLQPTIQIECELSFADITNKFYDILQCLEPFGPGNPNPLFVTRGVMNHHDTRAVGRTAEHLKLDVTDNGLDTIKGIAFGKGNLANYLLAGEKIDICYSVEKNVFQNCISMQIRAQDIHYPADNRKILYINNSHH